MISLEELQESQAKAKIPKGIYCYDEKGNCPYWKMTGIKCGYCSYLDMDDELFYEGGALTFLWDSVKECDINMDWEDK